MNGLVLVVSLVGIFLPTGGHKIGHTELSVIEWCRSGDKPDGLLAFFTFAFFTFAFFTFAFFTFAFFPV
jgi:hypothetical protein